MKNLTTVEKIKVLLERKGLKQQRFAELIGLSERHVSRILNGEVNIKKLRKEVIDNISEALDIPVQKLFYEKGGKGNGKRKKSPGL